MSTAVVRYTEFALYQFLCTILCHVLYYTLYILWVTGIRCFYRSSPKVPKHHDRLSVAGCSIFHKSHPSVPDITSTRQQRIQDIFGCVFYSGRKWRHIIHLYLCQWFEAFWGLFCPSLSMCPLSFMNTHPLLREANAPSSASKQLHACGILSNFQCDRPLEI